MKFPKVVKVKGQDYEILFDSELTLEDAACAGIIDTEAKTITLDKFQGAKDQKIALIHELLHAVLHESCATQANISLDLEEIIVENISRFLYDTFIIKWKS